MKEIYVLKLSCYS